MEKYHKLKAAIRSGVKAVSQEAATQTQGPDIEKLKEELRKEVKKEFQKKVNRLTAVSKSDLNGWIQALTSMLLVIEQITHAI